MSEKGIKPRIVNKNEDLFDLISEMKISNKVKWVSDGVGEDYKSWHPNSPILLDAMTGFGKNSFVENSLLPHAKDINQKVLIISNRIANNLQLKMRIANMVGCGHIIDEHSMLGLNKQEAFNYVRILSYQRLNTYIKDATQIEKLKSYRFVVLDECHFFTSDSLFNNQTWKIFRDSIRIFLNSVRIYMTSTSQEILPEIVNIESELGYSNKYMVCSFAQSQYRPPKEILHYKFKRNYSYITPYYFNEPKEIIEKIQSDKSKNKWCVFVTSMQIGKKFVEELGTDSVFISKDSKGSDKEDGDVYTEIISKESFSYKVLITTSVLDNGINLKDPLLKNIVIFSTDQVELTQMIGRKRIMDNESLNLFICNRDTKYFSSKLNSMLSQLNAIKHFKKNSYEFFYNSYNNQIDYELTLIQGYLFIEDNPEKKLSFGINELAVKKLKSDCEFYQRMIEKIKNGDDAAYIKEVLGWLGLKKKYNATSWLNYVSDDVLKNKFIEFLDSYVDKDLNREEFLSFGTEFKERVIISYGKQPTDRPDRSYKATRMRSFFTKYCLNYTIEIKSEVYTLRKLN